jgi:hypothetical protein
VQDILDRWSLENSLGDEPKEIVVWILMEMYCEKTVVPVSDLGLQK